MILRGMARPNLQLEGTLRISSHAVVILVGLFGFSVQAQQTPPTKGGQAQTSSLQAATAGLQTESPPLDDVLLEETDDDVEPADLFSRVSFEYDHGSFSGGKSNNRERIKGEQAFGPKGRLAFGYEIPIIKGFGFDLDGGASSPSGRGLGDIKLSMSGVLSANERFKQAAKVEVTFPSAPDNIKGAGQLVIKMAWGFSTPLGAKTAFNGVLAYNKAATTQEGAQGVNTFEPEAIVTHEFKKRLAGFLDYDTYWDFNADEFGQTLKAGLLFALDEKARWGLSPYDQFPLNHFTSTTNLKNDVGIELSYRY
jgi:hypothetical protein